MKPEGALIVTTMCLPFFIISKKQRNQENTITPYNKTISSILPKDLQPLHISVLTNAVNELFFQDRQQYFESERNSYFEAIMAHIETRGETKT